MSLSLALRGAWRSGQGFAENRRFSDDFRALKVCMGFAHRTARWLGLAAALAALAGVPSRAADAPAAFQAHYGSLNRDKVFLRQGPGYGYRVLWEYHRKGYPVRIVASYDAWRRISDKDGSVGWVHQTMVTDTRTVLIVGKGRVKAHLGPAPDSPTVALLDPGVVAKLKACQPLSCKVEVDGTGGWIDKKRLWGATAGETFE
jgi:SH3-like domain-containing protein